jgi:hypothetical protein
MDVPVDADLETLVIIVAADFAGVVVSRSKQVGKDAPG